MSRNVNYKWKREKNNDEIYFTHNKVVCGHRRIFYANGLSYFGVNELRRGVKSYGGHVVYSETLPISVDLHTNSFSSGEEPKIRLWLIEP